MLKQQDERLVKAALEANRERRLWKFMAWFSMIGAITSTTGFIILLNM